MTPSPRDIASVQTLPQLLAYRVASTPEGEAYRAFNPATHAWESWSWQHTSLQVQRWSAAIGAMQLPQAARIAILLPNATQGSTCARDVAGQSNPGQAAMASIRATRMTVPYFVPAMKTS